eukprot:gene484-753_t
MNGGSLVNAQHPHKRLSYSVHQLKAVPLDAITATDNSFQAELCHTRAQMQEWTEQLRQERSEHAALQQAITDWQAQAQHTSQCMLKLSGQHKSTLLQKSEEIGGLQTRLQRLEHALQDIQRLMRAGAKEP